MCLALSVGKPLGALDLVTQAALNERDYLESPRLASPQQDRHQVGVLANFPPLANQGASLLVLDAVAGQQLYPEIEELLSRIKLLPRGIAGRRCPERSEGVFSFSVSVSVSL